MDQAGCGECPLAGACADKQFAAQGEHERVLVDLVLLQALALGQQQRDDTVRAIIRSEDLWMVGGDSQTI